MSLFEMKPEFYWQIPKTESYQNKKDIIISHAIEDGDYIASEKIDGNWCRFVTDGQESKMQTRGISKVTGTYGEVHHKVPHIFDELLKVMPQEGGQTMVLGELYIPGGDARDIGSILRCLPAKAISRQENNKVHFRIFDVWYLSGISLMGESFISRVKTLESLRNRFAHSEYIEVSQFISGPRIYDLLNDVFDKGGEGIVLQRASGEPEPGKRPARKSLKIKKEIKKPIDVVCTGYNFATRDYTGKDIESCKYWENVKTGEKVAENKIMEYEAGELWEPITKGYYYGWAGSLNTGLYHRGKIVPLCAVSGLKEDLKADLVEHLDKYLNKPLVITGMEFSYTDKGVSVRHPKFEHFRDDINAEECTFEKVFGEVDIINP